MDKIFYLVWKNKNGFLFVTSLNLAAILYIASNIKWKGYASPDLNLINWVICILSVIHSIYVTPLGLWYKFIKQHVKPQSMETVSVTLACVYYISLILLWNFTGFSRLMD